MKTKHLKEVTVSALAVSYLALTNSSVVLAAGSGRVQSKLTQAVNTVQSILTELAVLVGICVALLIIIKRMPDADDPREKSETCHTVGRVAELVTLAAAVTWLLPWVYNLST